MSPGWKPWLALWLLSLATACPHAKNRHEPPQDAGADAAAGDAGSSTDAGLGDGSADTGCGDITAAGRCLSETALEVCVTSGSSSPHLGRHDCLTGERCEEGADGARCVLAADCVEGATKCSDASTLARCTAGHYQAATCPAGCISALGAGCRPQIATTTLSLNLEYELRLPKSDLSDWQATPSTRKAQGVMAVSMRDQELVDAAYTDASGDVTLTVPQSATSADRVVFMAARGDSEGRIIYAVVDAGYAAADAARSSDAAAPDPSLWAYSYALTDLSDGATLHIAVSDGSAALFVHQSLGGVIELGRTTFAPSQIPSLVIWLGMGTAWDCGACTTQLPVNVLGTTFDNQMWLDGSSDDQGYWSDAVSVHESGHYMMAGYGYPLAEGGPHYLGTPTNPGQAWSEGWATYFSSFFRDDGVYYDKQFGGFFWFDLDARKYGITNTPWQRPSASDSLEQLIDENEVAAMLRGVEQTLGDGTPLLQQLASPRMTAEPFERDYDMRAWDDADHPETYIDVGIPLPYHADFFDALLCSGTLDAADLDLITEPATHYPYPSTQPLCR